VTETLLAVRAIHLGAVVLLIGAVSFLVLVARPAFGAVAVAAAPALDELDRRLIRLAIWSSLVAFVSALLWLVLQAALASGVPVGHALNADTIGALLIRTNFGRVWGIRLVLMVILGGLLIFREPEQDARDWLALRWGILVLATALGASLGLAGHAAAVEGNWRVPNLVSDAVHVIATGIWLGGLLPLFVVLSDARQRRHPIAAQVAGAATRRFSALALGAVGTLAATGLANAWIQIGSVPHLVGTAYGRLLLLKLVLLGSVVAVAAVNRKRLLPRLEGAPSASTALHAVSARLRANVGVELWLGVAILLIAAALGVTPPARHDQPAWPFGFRLSWQATTASPQVPLWLAVGGLVSATGVAMLGMGWLRRHRRHWAVPLGLATAVYGGWLALSPLAIDAYPTTYLRPTVPYRAASIMRGAEFYRQHCAPCHGISGQGDGPAARGLARDPPDLTAKHAADHTAGDFFWWVSHGIAKGPMPGFARQLDENQRWDVINFVRALAAAETARLLSPSLSASAPTVVAPDFGFGVGVGPPETLRGHRGWALVHLVLFTLPSSLPRLVQLDAAWTRIGLAGARVIAVPLREGEGVYRALGLRALNFPIAVDGYREISEAYALFGRARGAGPDPPRPSHIEFLIDRQGYLRARWLPGTEPGWEDLDRLLAQVEQLAREAPRSPPPEEHVH
jgi:putative copper export protein/mono/diheme cytochrome c family protein/peroxiredoxin